MSVSGSRSSILSLSPPCSPSRCQVSFSAWSSHVVLCADHWRHFVLPRELLIPALKAELFISCFNTFVSYSACCHDYTNIAIFDSALKVVDRQIFGIFKSSVNKIFHTPSFWPCFSVMELGNLRSTEALNGSFHSDRPTEGLLFLSPWLMSSRITPVVFRTGVHVICTLCGIKSCW